MAVISEQATSLTGLTPTMGAAAAGDKFTNTGKQILRVTNGSGSTVTVTVAAQRSCNHGSTHDSVTSVPAAGTKDIGPFPVDRFSDATGYASISYSATTTVTVAVLNPSGS